jgi:hypothetical protein
VKLFWGLNATDGKDQKPTTISRCFICIFISKWLRSTTLSCIPNLFIFQSIKTTQHELNLKNMYFSCIEWTWTRNGNSAYGLKVELSILCGKSLYFIMMRTSSYHLYDSSKFFPSRQMIMIGFLSNTLLQEKFAENIIIKLLRELFHITTEHIPHCEIFNIHTNRYHKIITLIEI